VGSVSCFELGLGVRMIAGYSRQNDLLDIARVVIVLEYSTSNYERLAWFVSCSHGADLELSIAHHLNQLHVAIAWLVL
jgi:hypothetical protein